MAAVELARWRRTAAQAGKAVEISPDENEICNVKNLVAQEAGIGPSGHFPKFVLHRGTRLTNFGKSWATHKPIDSTAALSI
jgi:hypothetical protein